MKLPRMRAPHFTPGVDDGVVVRAVPQPPRAYSHRTSPFCPAQCFSVSKMGAEVASTSELDVEATALHVKHARGVVVAMGCASGLFALNVARKRDVDKVVIVDGDGEKLRAVRRAVIPALEHKELAKLTWMVGDEASLTRNVLSRNCGIIEPPTTLFVDYPYSLTNPGGEPQSARRLQSDMHARMVGWFGQEVDFVTWCGRRDLSAPDVGLDDFDQWCLDMDLVVYERSTEYLDYCFDVYDNLSSNERESEPTKQGE